MWNESAVGWIPESTRGWPNAWLSCDMGGILANANGAAPSGVSRRQSAPAR